MVQTGAKRSWSVASSAELYGLNRWGDPYFSINAKGHIVVQPRGDRSGSLDLVELLEGCLLYTSPSPRDATLSRMPSSA